MFGKLKAPCVDCPFVEGSSTNGSLHDDRIPEIKNDLMRDYSFTCHKTINYDERNTSKEQHCVGAALWLEKQDRPNQSMRIAGRLGIYKPEELKGHEKIIN